MVFIARRLLAVQALVVHRVAVNFPRLEGFGVLLAGLFAPALAPAFDEVELLLAAAPVMLNPLLQAVEDVPALLDLVVLGFEVRQPARVVPRTLRAVLGLDLLLSLIHI